ncbi:MAG: HAMP domain-containing histidine kinase [Polyangiaceae bacterium]|nr:HAMP domain-containing histidine kinase [Polyangiaceae bacterium]
MQTELAWLLAQEARSAARKLRQGVGIPSEEDSPTAVVEEGSGGVESTLNRLDEAVSALASLHGNAMPRGRRGKVDIAALVWEVAPEASVQIEMGEGTTVFGDEAELRRMLQVLIGQSGPPTSSKGGPDISIRREGDNILVHVGLGSENPATFATERAWLARMATRYGGSIKLDGSSHTLVLPADVDMQRRELESLKKELAAAQAQGQAYARELAAVFARGEVHGGVPSARTSPSQQPGAADGLSVLVAAARTLAAELRGLLAAIGRDIAPLREASGEAGDIAASVGRHVTGASELVTDLARLGACPVGELPRHVDVAAIVRDVVSAHGSRAERHDVRVALRAPEEAPAIVQAGAFAVLIQALIDHAIDASPPGSEVAVSLTEQPDALALLVDDAGPPLPPHAKSVILSRDFEAIAKGRSAGLDLVTAYAVAAHLALPIELEESPQHGARIRLLLPKSP